MINIFEIVRTTTTTEKEYHISKDKIMNVVKQMIANSGATLVARHATKRKEFYIFCEDKQKQKQLLDALNSYALLLKMAGTA